MLDPQLSIFFTCLTWVCGHINHFPILLKLKLFWDDTPKKFLLKKKMLQHFLFTRIAAHISAIGLCNASHWLLKLQKHKIFLNNENIVTELEGEMV